VVIRQVLSRFGELNRSTIRRTLVAVLIYLMGCSGFDYLRYLSMSLLSE
jgi:hypothetical protein